MKIFKCCGFPLRESPPYWFSGQEMFSGKKSLVPRQTNLISVIKWKKLVSLYHDEKLATEAEMSKWSSFLNVKTSARHFPIFCTFFSNSCDEFSDTKLLLFLVASLNKTNFYMNRASNLHEFDQVKWLKFDDFLTCIT